MRLVHRRGVTGEEIKKMSANGEFEELKAKLKVTWMTGNYDLFSRFMENDAVLFFRRLGVGKGTRLLDVGCGSGQLALIAARAGAVVTGCDQLGRDGPKSGGCRRSRGLF